MSPFAGCVGVMLAAAFSAAATPVPPAPSPEEWTFKAELAEPDASAATDLRVCGRTPWLRHRISRCYFSPIKRPPFNRDELTDDVDYYPDAYLERLACEGVNGLWLSIELRDLSEKHYAKLRRTVEKCGRHGIRVWPFCIEPRFFSKDDPLVKTHPEMFSTWPDFPDHRLLCPSTAEGRRHIEESVAELFRKVPGLPGILNLSHGERPTTCLSAVNPVTGHAATCPRCRSLRPWEIHARTAEAFVKGMRSVNPDAEFLSWFYQPHVASERAPWVFEIPQHLPDGVTMLYNFESGAVKNQLGRYRSGGDYWLSYVGPSPAFERVAESARHAGSRLGAKIQVACSHECATVPYVPVPGLLYRKYRAMRTAGCTSVMQCWYFGNYPGLMNRAAGELAFSDFTESEDEFLLRLAKPDWGVDAAAMAKLWKDFSDAYAEYPLSNDMQYYGPFHAGVAWPLEPFVRMKPLARTWKPQDPPSGDAIGECLENHTLDEASILASLMKTIVVAAAPEIARLEAKYAGNAARTKDLGVLKAFALLLESASDVFDFYRHRARAVAASRLNGDSRMALSELAAMKDCVLNGKRVTAEMLPLARADSRLGFHSEAEVHQFYPAKLVWRQGELDRALSELAEIETVLKRGETYPLSEHEQTAARLPCGEWTEVRSEFKAVRELNRELDEVLTGEWKPSNLRYRFRPSFAANGDFVLEGAVHVGDSVEVLTFDACAASWPRHVTLRRDGTADTSAFNVITPNHVVRTYSVEKKNDGWTFRLVLNACGWDAEPARRPAWICFRRDGVPVWPEAVPSEESRLNIGNLVPGMYGRIISGRKD